MAEGPHVTLLPTGLHFISGLPRSGPTLLSALLGRNPRFYAGMSGPVAGFFTSLLGQMSGANEFSVFLEEAQKKAKGLFENYYAAHRDKVVFDTGRRVKAEKRETILPPDLFRRYEGDSFWNDPSFNRRRVRVV
jgi:sulfotransferase